MKKQQQQQGKKGGGGQQQQGKKGGQQQQQQQQKQGKKGNNNNSSNSNNSQQHQDAQEQETEKKFQAIVIGEFFDEAFKAVTETPLLMPIGTTAVRLIDHTLELLSASNILDVTVVCGNETGDKVAAYLRASERWKHSLRQPAIQNIPFITNTTGYKSQFTISIHKCSRPKSVGDLIRDVRESDIITTRDFVLVYNIIRKTHTFICLK